METFSRQGWIYCDKQTGEPVARKNGAIWLMPAKPSPEKIQAYGWNNGGPVVARRFTLAVSSREN